MKKIVIFSISLITLTTIYYLLSKSESKDKSFVVKLKDNIVEKFVKTDPYTKKCINLYKKLRYPNQSLIMRPPPQKPPADMMDEFTMNGKMPITRYWYINEAYTDSNSDNKSVVQEVISTQFTQYLGMVKRKEALNYEDTKLNEVMHSYGEYIKDKTVAVIGTQLPWIEAIAYDIGASSITTLDYTRKKYELPNLKWIHVNDYLEEHLESKKLQNFDVILSFSSIEHAGLGRYGDPLSPYGDVDAVQQVHCMLKPSGLFFLAVPTSSDGSNSIEYNAHRIYGKERLDLLFKGWTVLNRTKHTLNFHTTFILKKISLE